MSSPKPFRLVRAIRALPTGRLFSRAYLGTRPRPELERLYADLTGQTDRLQRAKNRLKYGALDLNTLTWPGPTTRRWHASPINPNKHPTP